MSLKSLNTALSLEYFQNIFGKKICSRFNVNVILLGNFSLQKKGKQQQQQHYS